MIVIRKSETADTRTCDFAKVTREQLLKSSYSHIGDVERACMFFMGMLQQAAKLHDFTKLGEIDQFHQDFSGGFKTQEWYEMHKRLERHHISVPEGVRDDINLIDVLEYVADCVMAGMARSGAVWPLELSNETLQKAFQNTVTLLKKNVELDTKKAGG